MKFLKTSFEFKIISTFICFYFVTLWVVQIFALSLFKEYLFLYGYMNIMVIYFTMNMVIRKKIIKPTIADISVLILILLGIISAVRSVDMDVALYGVYSRNEGLYSFLCYYFLFLISSQLKSDSEKKVIALMLLALGTVSCIAGILSGYGCLDALTYSWRKRAAIPFGNPNFFSSVAAMTNAACIGVFMYGGSRKMQVLGLAGLIISFAGACCADCMGPYTGIIMVLLIIIVMEFAWMISAKDKSRFGVVLWKIGLCIVCFIVVFAFTNATRDGKAVQEVSSSFNGIFDGLLNDRAFSGRMQIWKVAVRAIPDYWLTGIGVDCFEYITMNSPEFADSAMVYDKAHNEYLNLWLTQGTFAVITYLVFLFSLFFSGLKKWKDSVEMGTIRTVVILFFVFFAYIAQAFFNISVIQVAPFFWITCGLMNERRC